MMQLLVFVALMWQSVFPPVQNGSVESKGGGVLEVHVKGLANKDGQLIVAIYKDDPPGFPEADVYKAIKFHPITALSAKATFTNLPSGRYAVTIFHDEDGDEEMDYNLVGIPKEGYGFSKNFRPKLSAPDFDDVAIHVDRSKVVVPVSVRYGI